jgi:hypothetical protein
VVRKYAVMPRGVAVVEYRSIIYQCSVVCSYVLSGIYLHLKCSGLFKVSCFVVFHSTYNQ